MPRRGCDSRNRSAGGPQARGNTLAKAGGDPASSLKNIKVVHYYYYYCITSRLGIQFRDFTAHSTEWRSLCQSVVMHMFILASSGRLLVVTKSEECASVDITGYRAQSVSPVPKLRCRLIASLRD